MLRSRSLHPSRGLIAAAVLAACSGGDAGTGPINQPPPPDPVSAASSSVATAAGAITLASGTQEIFDATADIGDSWRFSFQTSNNTFNIFMPSTRLGLTPASGSFTRTTSADGTTTTYVSSTPNATFDLAVDNRTKILTGVATLRGNAASVAGSGYAPGPGGLGLLAGDYAFASFTSLTSGRTSAESAWGTLRVTSTGTVNMCTYGQIDQANNCSGVVAGLQPRRILGLTPAPYTANRVQLRNGTADFGIAMMQAGDRGATIIIDRYGPDTTDPARTRVGTIYAVLQRTLAGSELDGEYQCSYEGSLGLRVTARGTGATIRDLSANRSFNETLSYNRVKIDANTTATLRGFINSRYAGDGTPAEPVSNSFILALSSSMIVVGGDEIPPGRPLLCGRR